MGALPRDDIFILNEQLKEEKRYVLKSTLYSHKGSGAICRNNSASLDLASLRLGLCSSCPRHPAFAPLIVTRVSI